MNIPSKPVKQDLEQFIPLRGQSFSRLIEKHNFPKPRKIGGKNYFDKASIYEWIAKQATPESAIQIDDILLDNKQIGHLIGRSSGSVWANVTKNDKLTKVKILSKTFHIEREIREHFADLIEIAEGAAA